LAALWALTVPAGAWAAPEVPTAFRLSSGEVLEGARLGDPASPLGAQAARVRQAIADELEVDASPVPVHVVKNTDLPLLHKMVGGALGHGWELSGFELSGHVFVKRGLVAVPDSVLVHEVLHAESERFSGSANMLGCHSMVEGIDQWFTLSVMRHRLGLKGVERDRTYVGFTEFADLLAALVGPERLRQSFFRDGFPALEREIDRRRGRGALRRACAALERRELQTAMQLGAAP
jgi:hypothetical protein